MVSRSGRRCSRLTAQRKGRSHSGCSRRSMRRRQKGAMRAAVSRRRSSSRPAKGTRGDRVVSLHVEDHPDPLVELRRLVRLHDAYALAGEADERVNEGGHDEAARLYQRASELRRTTMSCCSGPVWGRPSRGISTPAWRASVRRSSSSAVARAARPPAGRGGPVRRLREGPADALKLVPEPSWAGRGRILLLHGYVDIHSHILPGIDDGPRRTWRVRVRWSAAPAAEAGVSVLAATPIALRLSRCARR